MCIHMCVKRFVFARVYTKQTINSGYGHMLHLLPNTKNRTKYIANSLAQIIFGSKAPSLDLFLASLLLIADWVYMIYIVTI